MKTNIKRIDSLTHNDTTATKNINDNFAALQAGIEDALSRTGKTPNFMDAELDMNTRRVINVGEAVDDTDAATWGQMKKGIERAEAAADRADNSANRAAASEANARQYASEARDSRDRAEQAAKDAKQYRDETEEIAEQAKKDIKDLTDSGLKQLGDQIDNGVKLLDETISEGKKELDETINEGLTDLNNGKREIEELVKSGEGKIKDATDEGVRKIESATEGYQTVDNMVGEILEGVAANKYPSAQAVIDYVATHGGAGGSGIIALSFNSLEGIKPSSSSYVSTAPIGYRKYILNYNLSEYLGDLDTTKYYVPVVFFSDQYSHLMMKKCKFDRYTKTLECWLGSQGHVTAEVGIYSILLIPTSYSDWPYGVTNGLYESVLFGYEFIRRLTAYESSWISYDGDVEGIPSEYKYKQSIRTFIISQEYTTYERVLRAEFTDVATITSGKLCPLITHEIAINNAATSNAGIGTYDVIVTLYAKEPIAANGFLYLTLGGYS